MENKIRVGLVEDNALVAEGTRSGLDLMGYIVVGIAASGQQAIDMAEEHRPDIIIMDIKIAGPMDGIDAARIIYQRFQTPIVFLTAFSDDELVARARDVGACGYLVKPYNLTELTAMLEVTHYKAKADRAFQEMQKRTQQLEKAESLARMAGAVAHNYNNALTGVTCNLELVLEEMPVDVGYRDLVQAAYDQSCSAANIGRKMLDYVGQTFRVSENLDLVDLLKSYLAETVESAAIPLEIMEAPLTVYSNPDQLRYVLDVLLSNACESQAEPDGCISIRIGAATGDSIPRQTRAPVDYEPADTNYAFIEVIDKGCGIAPDVIEKIFDPFFSTKFAGRGLGLASALGLIKASNGCITVESQLGHGSRFCVWLPVV